ncbi:unnamed protein product, partial [Vitis vinifera]
MFWSYQRQEIEQVNDFKNHQLPLARIKKIMKADEDRRTLQKNDIAAAITRTDIFDFLVDIVPRDEIKDEGGLGMVGSTASGVPYYYPPMGQPAPGVMMGRPAVPGVDPGVYVQPPSQAWQSVWQTAEDGSYGSGGSSGQGNLDGQGVGFLPPPPIIVYLFGEEGFDLRPGDEKGVEVRQPVMLFSSLCCTRIASTCKNIDILSKRPLWMLWCFPA